MGYTVHDAGQDALEEALVAVVAGKIDDAIPLLKKAVSYLRVDSWSDANKEAQYPMTVSSSKYGVSVTITLEDIKGV